MIATVALQLENYTKEDLAKELNTSPRTIQDDIKFLGLEPVEIGSKNKKLYSFDQMSQIIELRKHCQSGNNRSTFVGNSPAEVIGIEDNFDPIITEENSTIVHQPSGQLTIRNYVEEGLRADIFFVLENLQRISDNKWLFPTKDLAELTRINPKTLLENRPYLYYGFVLSVETKQHGKYWWKVEANNS